MERVGTATTAGQNPHGSSRSVASLLAEMLGASHTTVTEFLEDLVNEKIYADNLVQVLTPASDTNRLSVEPGHPLTRRTAVLRGRASSRAFLHAETLVVGSRLPEATRSRLETSTDPIGRVLVAQGLAVTRVHYPAETRHPKAIESFIYARGYRLDLGGVPVMEIEECFLPALEEFLVPRM